MLSAFQSNIQKNRLFDKSDQLLLAFSGGVDSVVLVHLLQRSGYAFALAHCNFQLRGAEADSDEQFCREQAAQLGVRLHLQHFDTAAYASEKGISIQMAARELRYNWFRELCDTEHYTTLLTAHHLNDQLETFLVNLVRGTGIQGLKGIAPRQQHTARPLLFATKAEILTYAQQQHLPYREDSSNAEVKYKRNYLRHEIIPRLKTLNPSLEHTFHHTLQHLVQASDIVTEYAREKRQQLCTAVEGGFHIAIHGLLAEPRKELLLHEWLYPLGFEEERLLQLLACLERKDRTGKQFYSASHVIVIDRQYLIVEERVHDNAPDEEWHIDKEMSIPLPIHLELRETAIGPLMNDSRIAQLDASKISYPLRLRKWQQGDRFQPLGLDGFQKLSDFFVRRKLNRLEKQKIWVLLSGETIIWVIGHRIDDRYKLSETTNTVLQITYRP